jgi:hypothetical protein
MIQRESHLSRLLPAAEFLSSLSFVDLQLLYGSKARGEKKAAKLRDS